MKKKEKDVKNIELKNVSLILKTIQRLEHVATGEFDELDES